jgi:hypothetical protein
VQKECVLVQFVQKLNICTAYALPFHFVHCSIAMDGCWLPTSVFRIRIDFMRIRIQLFKWMRIRIQLWKWMFKWVKLSRFLFIVVLLRAAKIVLRLIGHLSRQK